MNRVPCPLCAQPAQPVWRENTHTAFRCESCGTAFMWPLPSGNEAIYDAEYFARWYLPAAEKRTIFLETIVATVPPLADNTGSLLDVGCGAGLLLSVMKRRGWKVEGQDISRAAAQLCEKQGFTVHRGNLRDLEGKKIYDAITLFDVLAHLPNPIEHLNACARLLKPGGTLVVKTPCHPGGLFAFARATAFTGKSRALLHIPAQIFHFDIGSLRTVLEKGGFSEIVVAVKNEGMFGSRRQIASAAHLALKWCGLNKTLVAYGKKQHE